MRIEARNSKDAQWHLNLSRGQNYRSLRSSWSHTLGLPWHRSQSPAPQRSPGMTMQKEFDQNSFQSDICCLHHFFPHPHPHQLEQTIHFKLYLICHHLQCNKWSQHLPASLQVSSPSRCILIGLVNPSMEVKTSDRGEADNHGGLGFLGMLSPFMHM